MSTTPRATSSTVLETKYGKIISATPHTNGTTIFCLLPYTKKPSPIEPNSTPQRSDEVFMSSRALAQKHVGRTLAREVARAFIPASAHIDAAQKMLPATEQHRSHG